MNIGIIDIGNTKIKVYRYDSDYALIYQSEEWNRQNLRKVVQNFDKLMVSNVRFELEFIENELNLLGVDYLNLTHKTPLPIRLDYKTPNTLGRDRIATAVAAFAEFPNQNCLIFDIGTCMTIDFVDEFGLFQGGRISPGLHMRLEAMHKQTGKLPLVNPLAYHPQIGKSTEEALFSGAFYGLLHEIEGTITAFKQDYSSLNIILTGGDAKRFDKRLKNSIFADEFFLLKGLTHILKYNDQTPNP